MTAKGFAHLGAVIILLIGYKIAGASVLEELLITEVMADPAAVSDSNGEWFEFYNAGDDIIDLDGLILKDDGSNEYHFDGPLPITPGQYFVLARNSDPLENGGLFPDYVYRDFSLGNSGDEIVFSDGLQELLRLDYGPGFDTPGRSRELTSLPFWGSSFSLTLLSLSYGAGDIGTRGRAGSFDLAASAVPLPSSQWLFVSGLPGRDLKFLKGWYRQAPTPT